MATSSPTSQTGRPLTDEIASKAGSVAAFAELQPGLTHAEAIAEASRCLFCFDAPCTRACPTRIDVPAFIRQILHGDTSGAAGTILEANILGGSCARACPTEVLCEGACVDNTLLGAPVKIGRLQRFACDAAGDPLAKRSPEHTARENKDYPAFFEAGPDSGRRVAIVGAGPAGLTCAHELRKRGHSILILEGRDRPGGLNTYGIAAYKVDTAFALAEVDQVLGIGGIDLRLNSPVDASEIARLLSSYDAVFLGIGLGRTAPLGIEGEDLQGVWEALDFISQTRTMPLERCRCGRHVVVIGGGNTAVDAATAAVRLGAGRVTIAYRRTAKEMPAFAYEYELSKSDGIVWEFSATPVRIVGEDGAVTGIEFVRTRPAGTGRSASLKPVPGSNFTLQTDMVVKALGQVALNNLLGAIPGLKTDRGRVLVDPATGATSVPKLFAGGDCISKGAELVDAVRQGKIAAAGINAMFATKTSV